MPFGKKFQLLLQQLKCKEIRFTADTCPDNTNIAPYSGKPCSMLTSNNSLPLRWDSSTLIASGLPCSEAWKRAVLSSRSAYRKDNICKLLLRTFHLKKNKNVMRRTIWKMRQKLN